MAVSVVFSVILFCVHSVLEFSGLAKFPSVLSILFPTAD